MIQSVQSEPGDLNPYLPSWAGAGVPTVFFSSGSMSSTQTNHVPYTGVDLAAASPTTARVYVDLEEGVPLSGVTVQLTGTDNDGHKLPGSPLLPLYGPGTVKQSGRPYVLESERLDPTGASVFRLPLSWAKNPQIRLRATATGPPRRTTLHPRAECAGTPCSENNSFELDGIPFYSLPRLIVAPVNMSPADKKTGAPETLPDPESVLARAREIMPGGSRYTILPYQHWIDTTSIEAYTSASTECAAYVNGTNADGTPLYSTAAAAVTDCQNDAYYTAILTWSELVAGFETLGKTRVMDIPVGVNTHSRGKASTARTIANLPLSNPTSGSGAASPAGFVTTSRPLTSVMHEIGHMMGLAHAGNTGCANTAGDEAWDPDNLGRLQGWTADWPVGRSALFGARTTLGEREDTDASKLYDLMSYCANTNDADSWLSPRNWQRELGALEAFGNRLAAATTSLARAASASNLLAVTGVVTPGAGRITSVQPTTAPTHGAAGSVAVVRALDAAGRVITETPAADASGDSHREPLDVHVVSATVPAATARVELVAGGRVLDQHLRSPHRPVVRVLSPRAGALVGRRGSIRLSWSQRDADRDPTRTALDYSRDGGRTWTELADDLGRSSISLSPSFLAGSRRARIRVRVNDGFNETAVESAVFRAAGRPPSVHIDQAVGGRAVASSATVALQGGAVDDSGAILAGRALTWYDGRRAWEHGESVAIDGLSPGRHTIRLVARDRSGRTSSARLSLHVTAIAPEPLTLRAPSHVSRRARAVRIRIATTEPATLVVGSRRFHLGRTARTVLIPLGRTTAKTLDVGAVLRAYGRTTPFVLRLTRA